VQSDRGVDGLFSFVPVKRSHSVRGAGSMAVGAGEAIRPMSIWNDTVYGGDFLANQRL